ncbi:MAG: hypothetical protein WC030_03265 [Candidatus Paceibacterota bacterium]
MIDYVRNLLEREAAVTVGDNPPYAQPVQESDFVLGEAPDQLRRRTLVALEDIDALHALVTSISPEQFALLDVAKQEALFIRLRVAKAVQKLSEGCFRASLKLAFADKMSGGPTMLVLCDGWVVVDRPPTHLLTLGGDFARELLEALSGGPADPENQFG